MDAARYQAWSSPTTSCNWLPSCSPYFR
ncbi:MAG: membrane protein insertion efficiency factor YidD [Gammaproteobacteria bacterium]|nr:membrane protein insertion efficiency factor YidD [Gammaproteobacteria bacterium]